MKKSKWFYEENLYMPLEAHNKTEAIEKLGNLLLKNGYVKESFVTAVIAREEEFATGLPTEGMGVAIPHTDAHHVIKQAVAVGILDEPVNFCVMGDASDSEVEVSLILMLAVPDKDQVMTVLKQVLGIIQDSQFINAITEETDRKKIISMLDKQLNAGVRVDAPIEDQNKNLESALEVKLIIDHPVGLHARPATLFVKAASKYESDITVFCEGRKANAKSILNVLSLGAHQGCEITIQAEGQDAQQALDELEELVASNFGGVH
jgi:galactitol PTS system EIIA component